MPQAQTEQTMACLPHMHNSASSSPCIFLSSFGNGIPFLLPARHDQAVRDGSCTNRLLQIPSCAFLLETISVVCRLFSRLDCSIFSVPQFSFLFVLFCLCAESFADACSVYLGYHTYEQIFGAITRQIHSLNEELPL